jgi:hybrid cluster-associated redox disulfide protein
MVADIMARWPACTAVFVRRGMACPGCVMAPMMTLEEAAAAYRLDPADLLAEIVEAAQLTATA